MADSEIPEANLDAAAAEVVDYTLGAEVYDTFADFQRSHWRKAMAKAAPHLTAERAGAHGGALDQPAPAARPVQFPVRPRGRHHAVSLRAIRTLWCDATDCGAWYGQDDAADVPAAAMRRAAARRGWTRVGRDDLCPNHSTPTTAEGGNT